VIDNLTLSGNSGSELLLVLDLTTLELGKLGNERSKKGLITLDTLEKFGFLYLEAIKLLVGEI